MLKLKMGQLMAQSGCDSIPVQPNIVQHGQGEPNNLLFILGRSKGIRCVIRNQYDLWINVALFFNGDQYDLKVFYVGALNFI